MRSSSTEFNIPPLWHHEIEIYEAKCKKEDLNLTLKLQKRCSLIVDHSSSLHDCTL